MLTKAIAQAYLDEVAALVLADDWTGYCDCMSRPFHLVTYAETLIFPTPDDLRSTYDGFVGLLRSQHVTDYIRLVESAEQIDRDLITARYTTHLMSGGTRIMDPVVSCITLRLEGNRWRAASIANAVSTSRWPLLMPQLGQDPL